jgi:hypothetical protein
MERTLKYRPMIAVLSDACALLAACWSSGGGSTATTGSTQNDAAQQRECARRDRHRRGT